MNLFLEFMVIYVLSTLVLSVQAEIDGYSRNPSGLEMMLRYTAPQLYSFNERVASPVPVLAHTCAGDWVSKRFSWRSAHFISLYKGILDIILYGPGMMEVERFTTSNSDIFLDYVAKRTHPVTGCMVFDVFIIAAVVSDGKRAFCTITVQENRLVALVEHCSDHLLDPPGAPVTIHHVTEEMGNYGLQELFVLCSDSECQDQIVDVNYMKGDKLFVISLKIYTG